MATILKTDVDSIAQTYLRDRVNSNINPYHSGWYPGDVNTTYLQAFSATPNEAVPSARGWVNGNIRGSQVRTAAVNLGNYYSRVVKGAYGMHGGGSTYQYGPEVRLDFSAGYLNGSNTSFTMPLRLHGPMWRAISSHLGGKISSTNMALDGWVSGKRWNNSTWYTVSRKNNNTVFGSVMFITGGGNLIGVFFRTAIRNNNTAYFAVKDSAPGAGTSTKSAHTTQVKNLIASMGTPSGNITQSHVSDLYATAWNHINNQKDSITVDLTVCHNSASSGGGHSSRGRR